MEKDIVIGSCNPLAGRIGHSFVHIVVLQIMECCLCCYIDDGNLLLLHI